jgi:hypothetical protein
MNNSADFPILEFLPAAGIEETTTSSSTLSLKQTFLSIARSQIGCCEQPRNSNRGKDIEKYLRSVGLPGGYSWCMAFVKWCMDQACLQTGRKNPMIITGGVLNQWNHIAGGYKFLTPLPGDIFIMDFGGGFGHTGIVEQVQQPWLSTIDGNSNDEGSRDGYKVCRRSRKMIQVKGFIRIDTNF